MSDRRNRYDGMPTFLALAAGAAAVGLGAYMLTRESRVEPHRRSTRNTFGRSDDDDNGGDDHWRMGRRLPPSEEDAKHRDLYSRPDGAGVDEGEKPSGGDKYDKDRCNVCMDRMKDMVLLPCRHVCSCQRCAARLTNCPICRTRISSVMKIFTS